MKDAIEQSVSHCGALATGLLPSFFAGRRVGGERWRRRAEAKPVALEQDLFFCLNLLSLVAALLLVSLTGCAKREPPVSESEVKAVFEKKLPLALDDQIWEKAPVHAAKLLLQDMVDPRVMQASTVYLRVQSATDGQKIAFRISWDDKTMDDVALPGKFADAAAVQLPAVTGPDVPAPQMGEPGKPVEIAYWSAVFQARVNGRKDDIHALYPDATVDHYPFQAASLKPGSPAQQEMEKRYAPARNVGNPMAGPQTVPVQDLLAEGPGTLRPAEKTVSSGLGKYSKDGWTVLLVRPLPSDVQPGGRTQVAFAVWEGSHEEVGAKKMRTAWIPLALGAAP